MDNQEWMAKAKQKIAQIQDGTVFVVKELFDGVEWGQLTPGEQRGFGRHFKNEVMGQHVEHVRYLKKAQNNSALYIKQSESDEGRNR